MPVPHPESTIFFLCDIQTKFRSAIYGYDHIVSTANKLLSIAKILGCEVVCTTQYAKGLGPIDPAIDLASLGPLHLGTFDKTEFTMFVPGVADILSARPAVKSVVIFGVEAHVCVLQSAISFLNPPHYLKPYVPYIIADGVSSCNQFEVPIALDRMRQEGAIITTSESLAFQLVGSASHPQFKPFSQLVRDQKDSTTRVGEALLLSKHASDQQAKM